MTKQSLLTPTTTDHSDAHGNHEGAQQYREKWSKIKHQRNNHGELQYPWDFEVVQGFFKQSDPSIDDFGFNHVFENMGRLKSWDVIISELNRLNNNEDDNVMYKVVFFARHGHSRQTQIVELEGLKAWHDKNCKLTGNDDFTWAPDSELTELGIRQAEENREFWKRELELGAPIPSKFYVSPLQRACRTLVATWHDLKPVDNQPIVCENLREKIGKNLSDKRSSRTEIQKMFGEYGFITDGLEEEEDVYFTPNTREQMPEQSLRINGFLQDLFEQDCKLGKVDKNLAVKNTFISTTSHSGTIRSAINVTGHRNFTVSTGGMLPIVIKGTRRY